MEKPNVVFGDSLIFFLRLIPTFKVFKYAGKTLKGFGKKNEIYKDILKNIKNRKNMEYVFFGFGGVDLHLSFYYDFFIKKNNFNSISSIEKEWKKNINMNIEQYVKNISEIKTDAKKVVLGVFPSPLKKKIIHHSLYFYIQLDYNSLDDKKKKLFDKLNETKYRIARLNYFNKILKRNCEKYGIIFKNHNNLILNKDKKVKKELVDLAEYNIHLLHEPLLKILSKLPFYKKLGITKEVVDKLDKIFKQYLEDKKKEIEKRKKKKNY